MPCTQHTDSCDVHRRNAITKVAAGDYPTSVQLSGGSYASSATLAVPPTDAAMPGVYPQQIPAIATGQSGAPNSTSVVPQTTLGATNSSLPATASSPLTGEGSQQTHAALLQAVQQHHGLSGSRQNPVAPTSWRCSRLSSLIHDVPEQY